MTEQEFDGIALRDLVFSSVDFEAQREHVEERATRKGTTEFEPKVSWCIEAVADPQRLVGRTTTAVYVIGYSPSAGLVLRVVLQPAGHAREGDWIGLTAHAVTGKAQRQYQEAQEQ